MSKPTHVVINGKSFNLDEPFDPKAIPQPKPQLTLTAKYIHAITALRGIADFKYVVNVITRADGFEEKVIMQRKHLNLIFGLQGHKFYSRFTARDVACADRKFVGIFRGQYFLWGGTDLENLEKYFKFKSNLTEPTHFYSVEGITYPDKYEVADELKDDTI